MADSLKPYYPSNKGPSVEAFKPYYLMGQRFILTSFVGTGHDLSLRLIHPAPKIHSPALMPALPLRNLRSFPKLRICTVYAIYAVSAICAVLSFGKRSFTWQASVSPDHLSKTFNSSLFSLSPLSTNVCGPCSSLSEASFRLQFLPGGNQGKGVLLKITYLCINIYL